MSAAGEDVRRVVTGVVGGKSAVVSDEPVAPLLPALMPGSAYHLLWGGDETPRLPNDGVKPQTNSYFPPAGGFRATIFTLAPQASAALEGPREEAIAEMEEMLPGVLDSMEPENPGMHTSDSVECTYILSGEISCELDDGKGFVLRAGEFNVMNGTRHSWTNRGEEPVTLISFSIGAQRSR